MKIQSLFCKISLHWKPELESAVFTHAMRCGNCGNWLIPAAGERVEKERQWWEAIEMEARWNNPRSHPSVQDRDIDPWGGPSAA